MVKVIAMFMNTVITRSHQDGEDDDNYNNDEGGNHLRMRVMVIMVKW